MIDIVLENLFRVGDLELVYKFFVIFSRFEYALKKSGFLITNNSKDEIRKAKPDWSAFAAHASVKEQLKFATNPNAIDAREYLMKYQPRVQHTDGKEFFFKELNRQPTTTDEQHLLDLVQIVRNNLFSWWKISNWSSHRCR